jgi:Putative heavy-metal chelation
MESFYDTLQERALRLCRDTGMPNETVTVKARTLSTEEAIGNPEADDFPLQKGKERLIQARFGTGSGQAFTDQFGDYEGLLMEILSMPLGNNYRRAVFIATLNALLNHMGRITGTLHCKDREPLDCARRLAVHLKERYGEVRIGQVGFQPRMVEAIAEAFPVRLLDLDQENIGTRKFDVLVEGPVAQEDVIEWADLLLVTGSTVANGSIERFLGKKPVIFYGTTIAGAAHLMGWERFCVCSH